MSYQPNPNYDESDLGRYVAKELQKLSDELRTNQIDGLEFKIWYVLPDKPRAGQVYYADGTSWTGDGSSGEGLYRYSTGGSWVFVG